MDNESTMEDHASSKKLQDLLDSSVYKTQFFELNPFFLFNQYKEYISNIIQLAMNGVEKNLLLQSDPNEHEHTREIVRRIRHTFSVAVDTSLLKAESKYHAIFDIPPYVLLPEDRIHEKRYTEEDEKEIDVEIEKLEKRYKRGVCMETLLKNELEQSKNLDEIEKMVMEFEDEVAKLLREFEDKEKSWGEKMNTLQNLRSLSEQINLLTL